MTKLTKLTGAKGKCSLCGINIYEETGERPSPKAFPCGIDRTEVEGSAEGAGKMCPYENKQEQRANYSVRKLQVAGEGQIMYEGG